jgi:hypothetical protein
MRRALLMLATLTAAAAASGLTPGVDLYVPAVGHGLGQSVNGVSANWRADVWIFNPSETQVATVTVYLLLRNQANPAPAARAFAVNPGATLYLPDIVFNTFGLDNTYGGLRITSPIPVAVTGQSYDANVTVESKQRGTGTAGQFFSAAPAQSAIVYGDATDLIGVDQDDAGTNGTWRSNLALVETTGNSVVLDIQRYDGSGAFVGSIPLSLSGREVYQLNYVLTTIVSTPGTNQRVRVVVTDGTGAVLASVSRIDNRSGDPSTVEMLGGGRDGVYLAKLDKTTYDTPVTLTVSGGAIIQIDATVLFTSEDAGAGCTGGELLRLAQSLSPPAVLSEGAFSFVVSGTATGITATMQLNGSISGYGTLTGTAITTLTGAGACNGSKVWPLVGARLP